jgi:hypothetical protein
VRRLVMKSLESDLDLSDLLDGTNRNEGVLPQKHMYFTCLQVLRSA